MKRLLLVLLLSMFWYVLTAQNLDRMSMSSGGASTDEVNYVIGETFNFTIAEGDIILEAGSLGSDDDTGGDIVYTQVLDIAENNPMSCYPNPFIDKLNLNTGFASGLELNLCVYNVKGQVVYRKTLVNSDKLEVDLHELLPGVYHLSINEINNKEQLKAVKIIKK